ncbi:MAG: hypothetical protein KatS3mg102_0164 [Planctomycetota bacterium]|nr:MAG: hypothetical protein KatS3mg102_0164 [Planctomycetota bacterium]
MREARRLQAAGAAVLAVVLALGTAPQPVTAQQRQAAAPGPQGPGPGYTDDKPSWTIRPELERLESHMARLSGLSESLGAASSDLAKDFERYLQDQSNELLASQIERKMALYADQVVRDFDQILADQDVLLANFKDLRRKLAQMNELLHGRVDQYRSRLQGLRQEVEGVEQTLIELAVRLKETGDEDARKRLKRQFARFYRLFRLRNRNVRGYHTILENYQVLVRHLDLLDEVFGQLQEKFADLVQNLEHEKTYLLDAIELRRETTRLKQIMDHGIFTGERAIKNVTEKLAKLYLRVDAFTQVHGRIDEGLARFAETTDTLQQLSRMIDDIGAGAVLAPADSGEDPVEAAIEHFYEQRGKLRARPPAKP